MLYSAARQAQNPIRPAPKTQGCRKHLARTGTPAQRGLTKNGLSAIKPMYLGHTLHGSMSIHYYKHFARFVNVSAVISCEFCMKRLRLLLKKSCKTRTADHKKRRKSNRKHPKPTINAPNLYQKTVQLFPRPERKRLACKYFPSGALFFP